MEPIGDTGCTVVWVDSVKQAIEYLNNTKGNIFISTGSKELGLYAELDDYQERCYARVLSVWESVKKSMDLGFDGKHLIAMQGPFSKELNVAMLRQTEADYFVTKESGKDCTCRCGKAGRRRLRCGRGVSEDCRTACG